MWRLLLSPGSSRPWLWRELARFLRFGLVGAAAFLVDAAVLATAVELLGASPYWARLLSFLVASTAAWAMNRRFTFPDLNSSGLSREWARYLASTSVGGLCNLGAYMAAIAISDFLYENPVIPAGIGSIAGMFVNFAAARFLVFRGDARAQIGG